MKLAKGIRSGIIYGLLCSPVITVKVLSYLMS